jgi:hypothetical protein
MPTSARLTPMNKSLAIAAVILVLGIGGWLAFSPRSDLQESFYPSLADAAKDGAITRGWIPDEYLPQSSFSIREVHDLSPSAEWCAFEFNSTDSKNLLTNLKHVQTAPPQLRHVPRPGTSWWPAVLVGDLDVEQIHKSGFELYSAERPLNSVTTGYWLFAINWSSGRGFFYAR